MRVSETENRARLSAVERAEAELDEERRELAVYATLCPSDLDGFEDRLNNVVRAAQDIVLARLKTKAYDVWAGYVNTGEDDTPDLDAWDDALQTADHSAYDILWKREWQA